MIDPLTTTQCPTRGRKLPKINLPRPPTAFTFIWEAPLGQRNTHSSPGHARLDLLDCQTSYGDPFQPPQSSICIKLPIRNTAAPIKVRHRFVETSQHVQRASQSDIPSQPPTNAAPAELGSVTHVIDSCKVKLGPGYQILDINTKFEAGRVVVLGNLPRDYDEPKLAKFLDKYGRVDSIELRLPLTLTGGSLALVHFQNSNSAMQAIGSLDGSILGAMQVFACLQSDSSGYLGGCINNSVKVVWKAPSMCAYTKYDTFEEACDALRRLDDTVVLGRHLSASHHLSDQCSKGFSLRVEGLSPSSSMAEIISALRCPHVTLSRCNYTSAEASLNIVRGLLEKNAPLKLFEVIETFSSGQNVIVRATYFRPSDAIEIRSRLHGQRLSELGGAPLRVHYNQLLSFRIHTGIFEVIEPELRSLRIKASSTRTCIALRWKPSKTDKEAMCLSLEGEHVPTLASMKSELESILHGELVLSPNGLPLWHRFFTQSSGQSFLTECYSSSGSLVWCDPQNRTLRMFGPHEARQQNLKLIDLKLKELRQGTKLLALRTRSMHYLLKQGGLARLQTQYGTDVIRMDLLGKLLVVHGDPAAARAAGLEIHNGIHLYHPPNRSRLLQRCPVCSDRLLKPVALSCGHSYCQDCLRHLLASAQETTSFPIRCLGNEGNCGSLLSLHVIKALLTPEQEMALVRTAFSCYVLSHAREFHYCPTPNCSQVYRLSHTADPPPLQCPSCLRLICTYCHADHTGMTCRTFRDEHDEAFNLWRIEHNIKSCPNCKVNIERAEGCNHLACRCGTHICWQCLKVFREGSAVYEHMFQEHGGIGIG